MRVNKRPIIFLAIVLAIATFTPLVIPYHQFNPKLWGLPYTLWMGTIVSIIFIILTYLLSTDGPEANQDDY